MVVITTLGDRFGVSAVRTPIVAQDLPIGIVTDSIGAVFVVTALLRR